MWRTTILLVSILACSSAGCEASRFSVGNDDDGSDLDGGPGSDADVGLVCNTGRTYQGFGGLELTGSRVALEANVERARVKPFETLAGGTGHKSDYARVLGTSGPPSALSGMGPTFFQAPARWWQEPRPGAINLFAAYRTAYQGCKALTASDEAYAAAPDAASATASCAAWQTTFWRRVPAPFEIDECVTLAVTGTSAITDVRLRWATTCASVLTSAGFLTY
jgi:hypothetical protein